MGKPEVSVTAPPVLFVGHRAVIDISVTAAKPTKVEFIDAHVVGEQGWAVGSGNSRISVSTKFPDLVYRLAGEGVLPVGATRLTATIDLPPGTAPTHGVGPAHARLLLRIHVSIPWWPDGRYRYEFPVHVAAPSLIERQPVAIRSTPRDAAPDKPRIELGLASSRLVAGEKLVGTCAVFHLDDRDDREVELTLVPLLRLIGRGSPRERRGGSVVTKITLPAGSAGTSVPFAFRLPKELTPSFSTVTHELSWWLNARSGSFFGGKVDVTMPLEILDASAAGRTPPLPAAPRLGDERIAAELATYAARHGWSGGEMTIERELAGCSVQIGYEYRGAQGMFLVSRLEHPSLGLGLSVTPSSSLRHVFFRDVEVEIAPWDRANYVVARFAGQAVPFLRQVVPVLVTCEPIGTMLRWTDTELVFERAVSVIEQPQLVEIGSRLEVLARTVHEAHGLIAPPIPLAPDLAAWRAYAAQLQGTLTAGDLSISGTLEGLLVDIGVEWLDTEPVALRVTVGDPEAASPRLRQLEIALPRPASDVLGTLAAEPLVELLTRWSTEIYDLQVRDGVASAAWRLPGDHAAVELARARELVTGLHAVLVALEPGAGPYR